MTRQPDPIAPARGCALGLLVGALLWIVGFVALAVIVARCWP